MTHLSFIQKSDRATAVSPSERALPRGTCVGRLLLEGMGVDDLLASGPTRSFAFLIDKDQLFERLIIRLVNHALTDEGYQAHVGSE